MRRSLSYNRPVPRQATGHKRTTSEAMSRTSREFERLADEHRVLVGQYGRVQTRCSQLVKAQAIEIAALSARAMRLQAAVIVRDSALAWAREDRDGYLARLEASLVAADLVICQTGCLSHGAYWRVQDHCRRTGKACVLVEQPDAGVDHER